MKNLVYVLCLLLVMTLTVACGKSTQSTETPEATQENTENETENNSSSSNDEETYVLKLAHGYPTQAFHHTHMEWLASEVEKRSNGRLIIDIYPSGQLMPANQEVPAILQGTIDMSHSTSPQLTSFDPIWNFYELPFTFDYDPKDPAVYIESKSKFNNSENGGKVIEKIMEEKGIKILAWSYTGTFGALFTNNVDTMITDPQSGKGLKIRTPGGNITPETVKSMGASSITLAGTELVTSLQQNVIDGLLTTAGYAADATLPVKTYTVAPVFNPLAPVIISLEKFESLPKDLQDILVKAGEDLEDYIADVIVEGDLSAYDKLENEMGVEFYYPTEEVIEEWKKATQPVIEKFRNEVEVGAELLDALEELK